MCKSKKVGGLGIGRMLDKNKSFLAKWMWRFGSEFDSLWRTVLCAKYGVRKESPLWEWIPNMNALSFVKAIGSLLASGSKTKKVINEGLKVIIGDSNKADFWSFRIGDNSQLKSSCPRIYALANNKAGVVQEYGSWIDSRWSWNIQLRRPLFDWEKDQWKVLMELLENMRIHQFTHDVLT
ncbi:hypothetical protein Dsin_032529 [Dipteronia sinensis]|uniref:Uncharacterized protein n=1 Tax=Dipteronia sinensis TaxID=43782 RepID=A0AAD9Z6U7_9ROSI|nr:hypothetical protein Dsin_032529 [Dipteronia sinensis]